MTEEQLAALRAQLVVPRGQYKHFKGTDYKALGLALHSETLDPLVVYHLPELPREMWARPYPSFIDSVTVDGQPKQRFTYYGELYSPVESRVMALESFLRWCITMGQSHGGQYQHVMQEVLIRFPEFKAEAAESAKTAFPPEGLSR